MLPRIGRFARGVPNFLKSHLLGIVILGIATSVLGSLVYERIRAPLPRDVPQAHSAELRPASDTDGDAPLVTFRDGVRCYVNFSVVSHILDEDAAKVVAYSGGAENARAALEAPTLAAVLAVMERMSYSEVRERRAAIEQKLVGTLAPKYKALGLTLDSVSLREISLAADHAAR
jgi:hypothetical protein